MPRSVAECDKTTVLEHQDLWQPLQGSKSIRLLRLLPGAANETVVVELVHTDLVNAQGSYDALSYTWVNSEEPRHLLCNGQHLEIGANAYAFLHRLRLCDESRVVWMDCICINQNDVDERSTQVWFMHEIYKDARSVLIWLGPASDDSDLAMEFVAKLDSEIYIREFFRYKTHLGDLRRKSFIFDSLEDTRENRTLAMALVSLVQRRWVRRIWVQQESAVNLNTRVLCGQPKVSWDQFFSLAWLMTKRYATDWPEWVPLRDYGHVLDTSVTSPCVIQWSRMTLIQEKRELYADHHGGWAHQFQNLIFDCSWCEATDPSDHIYALLSLVTNPLRGLKSRPRVDYRVPWPVLYINTARRMLQQGWVDTLYSAGRTRQRDDAILPSWVPDWRYASDRPASHFSDQHLNEAPYADRHFQRRDWSAGGTAYCPSPMFIGLPRSKDEAKEIPKYSYVDKEGKRKKVPSVALRLTCILMDNITFSTEVLKSKLAHNHPTNFRRIMSTGLTYVREKIPRYFTGEIADDAYAATLIANTTDKDANATAQFCRGLEVCGRPGEEFDESPYFKAIDTTRVFYHYSFCATVRGLMCLAPSMAREGDYVAILAGYRTPVALRRAGALSKPQYELLGECYIHGMMGGAAWNLIAEFKCKYTEGSQDQLANLSLFEQQRTSEYAGDDLGLSENGYIPRFCGPMLELLGKRFIELV